MNEEDNHEVSYPGQSLDEAANKKAKQIWRDIKLTKICSVISLGLSVASVVLISKILNDSEK